METGKVKVWDPFVRVFHWSLVVLFVIAYFTGDEENWLHEWSGYAILVLILLRLVWGLVGSRHARFTDFLRSPAAAGRYLRSLFTGNAPRYLGHNPAAGWMIVALLAAVLATGTSGMVVLGLQGEGFLAGRIAPDGWVVGMATPFGEGENEIREHDTNDDEAESGDDDEYGVPAGALHSAGLEAAEETWEELHEFLADFTVFLIALHILGVLASGLIHRENLVRTMITGWKRTE